MKRFLLAAVVLLLPGTLLAQQAVVDTMSALRALPVPSTDGYEVKLRGYYQVGDNAPQTYRWSSSSPAVPDGGAVITPSSAPTKGRWLLAWDGVTANVRTWGAQLVPNVMSANASNDSLAAINNAINALPIYTANDHSQSPGAAGSGHTRVGQLYFPGGPPHWGYAVSGEILVSAYMRILGDGAPYSLIAFLPNVASSVTNPKWVIRYLYNNDTTNNPNENFATGISGIGVSGLAVGNPGSCGLFFVGSNGTYVTDCWAESSLQPFKVDSKGVILDRLMTVAGCRGPGLELTGTGGAEIAAGYLDIEHVNATATTAVDPSSNLPYPAVWIHDLNGFSLSQIATEASPLSVRITNCYGGTIQTIHANPDLNGRTPPPGSAIVWIDGTADSIAITSMSESPILLPTGVVDRSIGVDTAGMGRGVIYNPPYGRGSYYQKTNAYSSEITNLKTANLVATNISGSGAGLTNIPMSSITGLTSANFQSQPIVTRSTDYILQDSDRATRQVYNPSTPQQLTLGAPTKTAFVNGWYFLASNTGSVPMTLQAPAGCTIDGQASLSLPPRTQTVITSDGVNYFSSLGGSGGERLVDFYELIQDAASISFAIPSGFHHLHLMSDGKTTSAQSLLVAQVNGDAIASHYLRTYMYTSNGTVMAGQEATNPGMCVGQMNDASAPYPAQNDTVISLGSITPLPSRGVSAVTNCAGYSGQCTVVNNTAQWTPPARVNVSSNATKLTGSAAITGTRSGAVVNSLTVLPVSGSLAAGSTFYLYGY